jgi:fructoselysine-6-P-deglycase FrlB-like protein/sugar/nucleoside kinase (ribokinase family)
VSSEPEPQSPSPARGGGQGGGRTPRVVVVGDLTLDDVVLPDGTTHMASIGGDCLYAALGARLWEPNVGIVTRRGDDFPRDQLTRLEQLGICLEGIVDIAGPTVRNWIIYEADGRRNWVYRTPPERAAEVAVRLEDIPGSWLKAQPPPVVHVAAMPIDAAERIVEVVSQLAPDAAVMLDTHEDYVRGYQDQLLRLAARVDVFLPSREELADLVGYDDPPRALRELCTEKGVPLVVVKMGKDGVLLWDSDRSAVVHVEAAPCRIVDVTGAGDAFCGGFAASLAQGLHPLEAARRGTVSAAFATEGFGSLALTSVTPADAAARLLGSLATKPSDDRFDIKWMLEEIRLAPEVVASQLAAMDEPLQRLATSLAQSGITNLYLVGCGDSFFAGAAATLAFAKHVGIKAEAVHALDMARYRVRYLPPDSAVLCVSYSGEVGRTIEAAAQARAFGHRVIALTGHGTSPLAREATDVVTMTVPSLGSTPGTISFLAMLMALFDLALQWGAARGNDITSARRALERGSALTGETLSRCEQPAARLAERLQHRAAITFIGAGPNEATARFGAAKLFEGPQMRGAATNVEEWAHGEYFISGNGEPVIVVAPGGAATDRVGEILAELAFIDADVTLISDDPLVEGMRNLIPLAPGLPEEFSPLVAALPLSLLAFHLALLRGKRSYNLPGPQDRKEHYETIHRATRGRPA